ncbi:MAG: hypothetical protein ABIF10_02240 [Candidatus Woesearchaeota archaeon]
MLEARALVDNLERVKKKVMGLGGVSKGCYACKNFIFKSWTGPVYLRLRVYSKNNWPSRQVIVTHKKAVALGFGKKDVILLRQEFDDLDQGFAFISNKFPGFQKILEFAVCGEEFSLGSSRFFVENVEFVGPSVEIEVNTEDELKKYFTLIGAGKMIEGSLPEYILKSKPISS